MYAQKCLTLIYALKLQIKHNRSTIFISNPLLEYMVDRMFSKVRGRKLMKACLVFLSESVKSFCFLFLLHLAELTIGRFF